MILHSQMLKQFIVIILQQALIYQQKLDEYQKEIGKFKQGKEEEYRKEHPEYAYYKQQKNGDLFKDNRIINNYYIFSIYRIYIYVIYFIIFYYIFKNKYWFQINSVIYILFEFILQFI